MILLKLKTLELEEKQGVSHVLGLHIKPGLNLVRDKGPSLLSDLKALWMRLKKANWNNPKEKK